IAAHDYRTAYRAAARQTPGPLYHDSKEADHGTVFTMQRRNRIMAAACARSSFPGGRHPVPLRRYAPTVPVSMDECHKNSAFLADAQTRTLRRAITRATEGCCRNSNSVEWTLQGEKTK